MEILIVLLVMLVLITLVGHGIWLALAAIYRAFSGEPETRSISISTGENSAAQRPYSVKCAECGAALQIGDRFCPVCGLSRSSVRPMDELATMTRQLDRFLNQGKLDSETYKLVMRVVEEERARLTAPVRREVEYGAPQPAPDAPIEPELSNVDKLIERKEADIFEAGAVSPAAQPTFQPAVQPAVQSAAPVAVPETPRQPRRSFTDMLETFMEESSIRWGELVGGLLIIGCSIALVVSLWSEIAARPFLKFSVFIGVTAALFGMGFYSAHRWKLPTTSRGVLVISTLLAPLNFLAMTAFSRESGPPSLPVVGGELFALALFFFLVYQAAKVFLPEAPWMTALATMGPSFAMLLARHANAADGELLRMALLGVAPLICYCASCGMILRDQAGQPEPPEQEERDERRADQIFTHLGIASFAVLLPLGLLFIKPGRLSLTLRQFAPLVSVFAIPALATGVALLRWPVESQSGRTRTAATSAALIGSLISLGALIFAWPNTVAVIVTASINCAVALMIALLSSRHDHRHDLRLAHAGAIAHFSLSVLVVANLFSHNVTWWGEDGPRLLESLGSKTSAYTFAALFTLFAAASEAWLKKAGKIESRIYGISALFAGAIGLFLITMHGFGRAEDPHHAAPVYAFYALAAFVIAWRRENVIAGWIGSVLSSVAILQTLVFKFGQELEEYHPVRLSFLVFATIAAVAAVATTIKSERARKLFSGPLSSTALIASLAVAPFLIFEGWMTTAQIATRLLWLAAIWFVIAWLKRSRVLFAAFQVALAASVAFKTADLFGHAWPHSIIGDLRTMQAQAVALAILSLAWIAARIAFRRFAAAEGAAANLLYPKWPEWPEWLGVDSAITMLSLVFLFGLSLFGASLGMVEALRPGWSLLSTREYAATAFGVGSWALLAALALVFIAGLWERFEKRAALSMLILLSCACLLISGRWWESRSTPAIYRWSSAIAFAALTLLIVFRNRFTPWFERFNWPRMEENSKGLSGMLRLLSLALFAAPVLIFSSLSFFNWMNFGGAEGFLPERTKLITGLIAPLLIVGLSFLAHSIRERYAAYACAAGLMVNMSVTIGYLLWASTRVAGVELAEAYMVAQLNIIATSICSLVWIGFHRRQKALDAAWPRSDAFLNNQTGLAAFLPLLALVVAGIRIFVDPLTSGALANSFGGMTGVLSVALPALAYARFKDIKLNRLNAEQLCAGLIVAGLLLSCIASRFGADGWIAFHTLSLSLSAAAWLMLALRRGVRFLEPIIQAVDKRSLEYWITALALVVVVMILPGLRSPGEPWWTAGILISTCLLFAGLSIVSRSRGYLYLAAPALNFAAMRIYFRLDLGQRDFLPGLMSLNVIILALPAIAWLAIDLKALRKDETRRIMPFHRVAAVTSLLLLGFILFIQLTQRGESFSHDVLDWIALASVVALFAACLWDDGYAYALSGLQITGLIAAAMGLLAFNPGNRALGSSAVVILSLYVLATSALLRARKSLAILAARLRMPSRNDDLAFLGGINVLLGLVTYTITFVIVLNFESLTKRMIAATASVAIPISLALLVTALRSGSLITAKPESDNGPSPVGPISPVSLINLTTLASLLTAVLWGWAWMSPVKELLSIDRHAVVMVAAGMTLIGYGFIVRNLAEENEWRRGARRRLLTISAVGITALVAILSAEALNYAMIRNAGAPWWVVIAVFAALVSLFCACIAFALSPASDPFNLSERGRMSYVYVAETLTIVTALHARVTMPWFFGGFFLTWWPLIVMLLAFTGVGLGELFRRRGKLVLAEPLERTGILLPLLPALGFWVVDSQVSYSNLLFLVGLFYGALSVMRRSFKFGMLAVLAGNGGLWNLLDGAGGYGFYEHPQLWVIPFSVSILIAAHINRERLTKDQLTLIRYTTLMMIYVSSTSDIFINGVSESLWLTIVLTLLSVMGVFVGLMLRIRAFLFLGAAFLMLSLSTIIWTALVSLNRQWPWLVVGMVFGIVIIVAFAWVEKKRREMLELVERLKQWQA